MKNNLTLILNNKIVDLPAMAFEEYKSMLLSEKKNPSAALRILMDKYQSPDIDPSCTLRLIEYVYPEIDTQADGFHFRVIDSAYPNSEPTQFSDDDFDQAVDHALRNPPCWPQT